MSSLNPAPSSLLPKYITSDTCFNVSAHIHIYKYYINISVLPLSYFFSSSLNLSHSLTPHFETQKRFNRIQTHKYLKSNHTEIIATYWMFPVVD